MTVKFWPAGTSMPYSAISAAGLMMEKKPSIVASAKMKPAGFSAPRVCTTRPLRSTSAARSGAATAASSGSSARRPARVSLRRRRGEARRCRSALPQAAAPQLARLGDVTAPPPSCTACLRLARTVVVLHHDGRQRAELARRLAAEVGGVAKARHVPVALAVKVPHLHHRNADGAAGRVVLRRHRARRDGGGTGARVARPEAARARLGS